MLHRNILLYGEVEKPLIQQELQAGPLSLIYEEGDLRYIKLGDLEVLRGINVTFKDRYWNTVPKVISNVLMEIAEDWFNITYKAEHKNDDVDFSWKGVITGNTNGNITFKMEGVARSTFLRNRIGFCTLHPITECAGRPCVVETIDGDLHQGLFPEDISPYQVFTQMRAVTYEILPGLSAEIRLNGDIFEMEDQRNWTDASYKTYCTPLCSTPVEIKEGTAIAQTVTLTLKGEVPRLKRRTRSPGITFSVSEKPLTRLPRIGLCMASHGRALSQKELERLKALNLSHLRVDLDLTIDDSISAFRLASSDASKLGVPLEIALILSDNAGDELKALVRSLDQIKPSIWTWLIFHKEERSTPEWLIKYAQDQLARYSPDTLFGAGTNIYFTELNRNRPPMHLLDLACYPITPQVHVNDDNSLIENLEAQSWTVRQANQFSGGLPIAVTPVTFKPRFNPDNPSPKTSIASDQLPPQVDVRQMALFGAIWTACSLKYLSEAGAHSATYFETTGWRGVMETEEGSPLPEIFHSLPGCVYPLYHVLADVGEFSGGDVLLTESSDNIMVNGLAVRKDGRTRVLIANLCDERRDVTVRNLGKYVRVFYLDESNAVRAMRSPEAIRAREGNLLQTSAGTIRMSLLPYAVARIDDG